MGIISEIYSCVRYLKKDGDYVETSERTQAKDIIFSDGKNAETKLESVDNSFMQLTDTNKITSVKIVSSLPTDASSNPTTLYLVMG